MTWVALKMLTGDRSKYLAILFGVTFACFLIAEQSAIFCGVMQRTTGQIRDTHGTDVWVMNSGVRYFDDLKAISDNDVFRVRSVPGVAWAVNLYRGQAQAQLANGTYQGVILMGVDDSSLAGVPGHLLLGTVGDLQIPDAILVDEAGCHQMWPNEPLHLGTTLEMNQRRAVVVGIFRASQTFMTMPLIYTRYRAGGHAGRPGHLRHRLRNPAGRRQENPGRPAAGRLHRHPAGRHGGQLRLPQGGSTPCVGVNANGSGSPCSRPCWP
jgi:putative ABC transport system permease protein